MQVIQIATFKVKEGMLEEAIEALKEIVPKVRETDPGCLYYAAHTVKGRKNKNTIIFFEKYKDEEAVKEHNNNVGTTLAKLLPLCEPGVDLKTCFEII
ncbi:MAG: putative quinol monooxygenase [Promethearchaeota archaeon]